MNDWLKDEKRLQLERERFKQWRRGHERANEIRREELKRLDEKTISEAAANDLPVDSDLPATSDLPAACGLVNLQGKLLRNYVIQLEAENASLRREVAHLKELKAKDHADTD